METEVEVEVEEEEERYFFPPLPFSSEILFFLSPSLFSPRGAVPARFRPSLSPTRRHVPRVRGQERAARAARDGVGRGGSSSGSGKEEKRTNGIFFSRMILFLLFLCFFLSSTPDRGAVLPRQAGALRSAPGLQREERGRRGPLLART